MRILVIDHIWSEALLLGQQIHSFGHEVVIAFDLPAAFDALADRENAIDAVMIGLDDHHRSPLALARHLRREFPDKPVAFRAACRCHDDILQSAHSVGPVLVCSWTPPEVRQVMASLGRMRLRWTPHPTLRLVS